MSAPLAAAEVEADRQYATASADLKAQRQARRRLREERMQKFLDREVGSSRTLAAQKQLSKARAEPGTTTEEPKKPDRSRQLQAMKERQEEIAATAPPGTDVTDPLYVLTVHYGPMPTVRATGSVTKAPW